MLKVTFYCDIQSEDGDIIEQDFDFDEGTFKSQEELDKYCDNCGYAVGEPCGYWGNDVGILKEIFQEEDD